MKVQTPPSMLQTLLMWLQTHLIELQRLGN